MTPAPRFQQHAAEPTPPSTEALEGLVAGLFDYAGMFPPANLELDAALAESARSPRLHRPGLVGADLVVALDDLARLDEERLRMAGFGDTEAKVAVVAVEAGRLEEALLAVAKAQEPLSGVARIVSLEVHGTSFPSAALRRAAERLQGVQLYIEPRMPDAAWGRNLPGVLRLLGTLRASAVPIGLKVRGSGATAVSARTLGALVPHAVARGLPLKATAGLHHPIVEPKHGNRIGFLGLAAALRLRGVLGEGMSAQHVEMCVGEQDPRAFAFDGELSWRGHAITLEALREAVRTQPFAIGSCSLREPDDDLMRLFGPPVA